MPTVESGVGVGWSRAASKPGSALSGLPNPNPLYHQSL